MLIPAEVTSIIISMGADSSFPNSLPRRVIFSLKSVQFRLYMPFEVESSSSGIVQDLNYKTLHRIEVIFYNTELPKCPGY
jgi:hypothetical protein